MAATTTLPMLRVGRPTTPKPRQGGGALKDRWWFLIVAVVALTIFSATDTGRIIFDSKLGVDLNASEFLVRLWSLWNPLEWFGSLQDQYVGYAIPMAPFFLAGQLAHVPIWLIERLWLALLVTAGFAGLLKLARALRIGTDGSRLLASAVFALWPTFTIVIGSTSAAALPGLLVPWAVLPLVSAVAGRVPDFRAVARSSIAIALMGGVNAASTLAVLVLPALYVLTHTRGRRRVELGLKWLVAVVAATAWWTIPLLLQGRYSFNFLPYIEQSATTSGTLSAAAMLRGTGNWTAYFNLGGTPWLAAGWAEVTSPGAILASVVAAAVGLAGLARRDMPERRWLCLCVGLVAAVALAGYYGPLGGPFHRIVDSLLNGPMAPIRSLYKLEPVIAVALALGCAHAMDRCWRANLRIGRSVRLAATAATAPAVALVLAGLALPYLSGQVLQAGSFTAVPAYWYKASAYLAAHSARQTALVVPANPHGQYTWGDTIDDALEPLATSPWVERGLVPYGGAGSQVLLQTAEQAIESGAQVAGLPAYLARAGIRYVVVRNDTNPAISGYTPPQVLNETLEQSGFQRVASFGPQVAASPGYPNIPGEAAGFAEHYPAIEIFQARSGNARPASPVAALPLSQTVLVNGGPDALLQLAGQGVLGSEPTVMAGQKLDGRPALWAVTDAQRRADNDYGTTDNFQSFTYTAHETNPVDDPLGGADGPPRQLLPVAPAGHQTVAVLSGAASVTASSDGTWAGESPQYDPVNAFDGNPATAWAESNPTTPVGQWIQIDFSRPIDLPPTIGIRLLNDSYSRPIANQLRVTTQRGSAITDTVSTGAVQRIRVRPGPARWLRITITGASNVVRGNPGAGISDVLIPGVKVQTYLEPAQDAAGAKAPAVVYSFTEQAAAPSGQEKLALQATSEQLNRIFTTPAVARLAASITAEPTLGPALTALIAKLSPAMKQRFRVTASSSWDSLPEFGPDNIFEPHATTPWLADAGDVHPTLELSWHGRRTISSFVLKPAYGLASAPTGVLVGSPNGYRLVNVGLGGAVRLSPPLRTDKLYLVFAASSTSAAGDTATGQPAQLPVGLAGLSVPGLSGLRVSAPVGSAPFRLGCGSGPAVVVEGRPYQTSVSGKLADLIHPRPVRLRLCSPGGALSLPAGSHRLTVRSSADFAVTNLTLSSQPNLTHSPGPVAQPRKLKALTWGADNRTLRIGPGQVTYVEVHENFNPGWAATINGRPLSALTLDGWQQAFVVPAGRGGTITLTFRPAATYHDAIIGSGVALLFVLAAALGIRRRRKRRQLGEDHDGFARAWAGRLRQLAQRSPGDRWPWKRWPGRQQSPRYSFELTAQPAAVFSTRPVLDRPEYADALIGRGGRHDGTSATPRPEPAGVAEQAGLSANVRVSRAGAARKTATLIPLAAAIAIAGGVIAVAVPVLAIVAGWRPRLLPAVAVGGMLLAGVLTATSRLPTVIGNGPFSGAAQVCALIALAAALFPATTPKAGPRARVPVSKTAHRLRSHGRAARPKAVLPRQPFSLTDEVTCYFDNAAEPVNIHLEMRLDGHLDRQAFGAATAAALLASSVASRRRAAGSPLRFSYAWEQPARLDFDPTSFTTIADSDDLARKRAAFLACSPSIDSSPPALLLLASGPDCDYLILNAHHAAMDALSWLELLRDIGRRYRGDSADTPVGVLAATHAATETPDGPPVPHTDVPAAAKAERRRLPALPALPARIARDGGSRRGYGLQMILLPEVPTPPAMGRAGPATLNEILVATLIVTIGRWNAEHGEPRRQVRITTPFNARYRGDRVTAGNLSRLVTLTATPPASGADTQPLLRDIARQARAARRTPSPPLGRASRGLAALWCPATIKRGLVRVALRTAGPLVCDTAMLTNLGHVPDPPDFGLPGPVVMAFSAQAQMPRGLTIGVITTDGRLQLTLRYNLALFDEPAAARFAARFTATLSEMTTKAAPTWH